MEFKVGDKVVCVRANPSRNRLTPGKIYTIIVINKDNLIGVINDINEKDYYFTDRFDHTLKTKRKEKLNKIFNVF